MPRILIIDDDQDIVESMRTVLESKGYQVIFSFSGEDGLKKAKQEKPDLVILDIMMETSDKGFDVAREIKKQKEYEDIPIIMLTAIKEKMGFDFQKEAGDKTWLPVDDYAEKPLRPKELISKIEKLLIPKEKS